MPQQPFPSGSFPFPPPQAYSLGRKLVRMFKVYFSVKPLCNNVRYKHYTNKLTSIKSRLPTPFKLEMGQSSCSTVLLCITLNFFFFLIKFYICFQVMKCCHSSIILQAAHSTIDWQHCSRHGRTKLFANCLEIIMADESVSKCKNEMFGGTLAFRT